jgi:2'-5' RNA ligase
MSKIRTFIAIEIPDEIRNKIGELQNSLKKVGGRISWTKPGNIHLTLKFLGDTDDNLIDEIASQLQASTASIQPIQITIGSVGTFPNFKYPRVIWVGAESEENRLRELAVKIEEGVERFGFKKENRPFSAHLTLGRVKDVKGIQPVMDKLKDQENFEAGLFLAKEVLLIKSELHPAGAIYTPLRKVMFEKS